MKPREADCRLYTINPRQTPIVMIIIMIIIIITVIIIIINASAIVVWLARG